MPKKTVKQLNQERLYEEWKRKRNAKQDSIVHSTEPLCSGKSPPPPPPPPPAHAAAAIKTPRREEYERLAKENREKYPEIAQMVDEIRKHFPGAKVISVTPRPKVIKHQAQATPSPDEEV